MDNIKTVGMVRDT